MDKVTLKVKECCEFESLGECYEGIQSVDEAIRLWERIPEERLRGIKSIGIALESTNNIMDGAELDILIGNHFDLEVLEYVPDILENKQAQDMIKELVTKLPDIEIRGEIPKELAEMQECSNVEVEDIRKIRHHR